MRPGSPPSSRNAAPLHGLVLCGGQSTRMRRDKAAIVYEGIPQARRAARILAAHCERVSVSISADRAGDPLFDGLAEVPDSFVGLGPMGGILSAFQAHPEAAWVVVACDMPFITEGTIERLVAARDPLALATAYASPADGLPEPVCALYEPAFRGRLLELLAEGNYSTRQALIRSRIRTIAPAAAYELDNVNDPAEYERARARLAAGAREPERQAG